MAEKQSAIELASYIGATGMKRFYSLYQNASEDWCADVGTANNGPVSHLGPFASRGDAICAAEAKIEESGS